MNQSIGIAACLVSVLIFSAGQLVHGDELLLSAASKGDINALQSLLEGNADVNYSRGDGSTALAWAVYGNYQEAVDILIRSGADVNAANDYGVTPLSLACVNGNSIIIERLLNAAADPDRAQVTGETPLMTCSAAGVLQGVKALLTHGADVNAKENEEDQTALMWAAAGKHPEIAGELVAHGADVHTRSRIIPEPEPYIVDMPEGETVFGTNYPATVRFTEVTGGFTALHFAAQQGDVETAGVLIDAGSDVNSPHPEHGSPLVIAIASGHEDLARFLLQKGADPNINDAWGVTPLHYALHKGVLILNNFKPSVTDRFGWTRSNMPDLVETLLDYGADPNARIEYSYPFLDSGFLGRAMDDPPQIDPVGATPLLLAAASGDIKSMKILEEVSDTSATTIGGASVFMLAAGAGVERGSRTEDDALEAARFALEIGAGDVNDHLIEIAADGSAEGMEDGRTTAHFIATLGWLEMMRFLAEHGADLNVADRYGMTPLMLAMGDPEGRYNRQVGVTGDYDYRYRNPPFEGRGNRKLVDLMLELGADPFTGEYRDRSGE